MDEPPRFRQSSRKFARAQRQNMTKAETMLWRALRNHQIDGYGFRRQMPIGPYFADFVCLARKIVVEADGRTHEAADAKFKDAERDAWFRRTGFFAFFGFPTSLSSADCRSSSSAFVRRCARHERPFRQATGHANWGAENRDGPMKGSR
jgi:very-short-patch-repair endonuclease